MISNPKHHPNAHSVHGDWWVVKPSMVNITIIRNYLIGHYPCSRVGYVTDGTCPCGEVLPKHILQTILLLGYKLDYY